MIDLILLSALILLGGYLYRTYLAPKKPEAPKADEQFKSELPKEYQQFKSETGFKKPDPVIDAMKDGMKYMAWRAVKDYVYDRCAALGTILVPIGMAVIILYLIAHSGA